MTMDPMWTKCVAFLGRYTDPKEMPLWWFYTSAALSVVGAIAILVVLS